MYRVSTRVVMFDSVMYNPGGVVRRWADRVNAAMVKNSKLEAPHGADTGRINKTTGYPVGSLIAMIDGEVKRVGPRRLQTTITSGAPYSVYVLEGTSTIYARSAGGQFGSAKKGSGMFIPGNPGWGRSRWRQRVRGQAANPFFDRAFARTARTHSSLR